ncbi:hypothetical protein K466DRAFT_655524 [Polyporus arcularius HHB13444]|uniref:MYND-type domain-containing protein n=1 Tax=Polyporus arcularius HHB13444 TaxID=1314778 RepID=A0A5C3P3J6_9APHY|nr:hypothetical protein K466DRAFT_655524 [Polyporus arcularius HHB13444]
MNTASDIASATPALRKCNHCGIAPTNTKKLRKCRGCLAAPVYCSKECQRADWPIHNMLSKERDLAHTGLDVSAQYMGYSNPAELMKAVSDFTEAHEWAFRTAMKAYAVLTYGANLDDHPRDQILRCRLACTTSANVGAGRNPAQGFKFIEFSYHPIESWVNGDLGTGVAYPELQETIERSWQLADERFRSSIHGDQSCTHYIGLRIAAFTVDGVSSTPMQFIPLYRVDPDLAPPPIRGDVRVALEELLEFCTRSINSGQFVLKRLTAPSTEIGPWEAVPGRYLRRQQNWVWEPLFEDWMDYESGRVEYPALSVALMGLKTPPALSMYLFRALWFHWCSGVSKQ